MPLHIDEYRDIIDGSGRNNITPAIEEAIKIAKEDNVRVRVYFRVKDTGTPTMRKVNEARFDPNVTSVDNVKQIILQKLEDSPGPEFSGTVKIEFLDNTNSNYLSGYQRNIRIGTVAQFGGGGELGEDFNDAATMMASEGVTEEERDEIIALLKAQIQGKDRDLSQQRAFVDASMGFMFKSHAQMHAMFERATRMMENYTLRFGFPHASIPGVTEIHGSGNSEPVAPPVAPTGGGGGGGNLGLLPMLIKLAGQLAQGGGGEPQQAPAITQRPAPRPRRNRMDRIASAGADVHAMRGGMPHHAQPADGVVPPPPMPDEHDNPMPQGGDSYTQQLMNNAPSTGHYDHPESGEWGDEEYDEGESYDEGEGYDEGESYDEGEAPNPQAALSQFNDLDAESMKSLVLGWVRASPENKAAAMDMGTDLVSEIMKGD